MKTQYKNEDTTKKFDRLAELLKGIPPERVRMVLMKEETLTIRTTAHDKSEMQRVAKACGLTLTEYLTRLHIFAAGKLTKDNATMPGKTPRSKERALGAVHDGHENSEGKRREKK